MNVEDVDVVSAQLLQRRIEGKRHRLDVVACKIDLLHDFRIGPLVVLCVLLRESQLSVNIRTDN